ncbi:autotransporter outer membrane beta-barrel domain-containing protein, partial [Campylobacter lari]|nr:autotransporter outer membrane beta-barrel domain-containing protein [Campylobacter lari]
INNSTIGKEATLYSMSNDQVYGIKNHGNIGQVNNNAVIFNGVYNANSITSLLNNGNIYSGIKNTGTIESLVNTKKAIIHDDIENDGTMKLTNYGTIGGITNSNSFTLINGYVQGSGKHAKYISGVLNKNKNGYHIENNGKGVFSINSWYFDAPEFLNKEDRLKNSVVLGGNNLGGIKVDEVYINTANLDTKKIYDSNTFFIDKKGNSIGNNTNDDKGIDAKNIHSLTDIYYFMNVPSEKGKYRVSVDINELSGKTLAKSMVYSARLRSINVSNLLRNAAGLNLQSDLSKNNRKYLDSNTTYYFLNPYYNHSSAKIGKSVGQLRMDTAGLIGGSFKQLPKDHGVIGFYLGHEDSSKKQNTQRLNFDDKTYYGGLTYYNVLKRKGLDEYYFSAYSKFDYTKTNIEKSYKNNPASSKANTLVYGYGAEAKIGANYYNAIDVARVSPEIGLSYYGMSSKNFSLNHLGGTKEHYLAGQFNFVDASAALKWYKPWTGKFKSNITIGSIVNLYTDARGKLKLDENTLTADVIISKYYGFGQFGLSYALNKHSDISLNYAGVFTFDNTTSHTMFLKLGLWW